jgi:mono/diheme cytochrome c family protein
MFALTRIAISVVLAEICAIPAAAQSADDLAFFDENVRPILEETCLECHDADKQKGGLRLDSRSALLRGGDHGLVVVTGDPDASKLIGAVRREGELKMPPKEELLPSDVDALVEWVRLGMPWPEDGSELKGPQLTAQTAAEGRDVPAVTLAIDPGPPVKFDRDIQPLLADRCYACHGPDGGQRKASLRLDDPAVALAPLPSGHTAIVPGNLEQSQMFRRIAAPSPDDRMPPSDFHKSLNAEEIQRLGRWIVQGATWEQHWAFQPVQRGEPPAVSNPGWVRNPIDSFVLARLDAEGLTPASEADRRTLIRRVTLDLTGLPTTIAAVRAFVVDNKPDAYERLVDQLLTSPQYGEHMARFWLDAARYADTNGFHIDNMRFMWRWRDWVIGAFNANMPFDEFTIEQLAGDLLPNPTLDQQIATGFNRNHMINFEGGAIPEEYCIQYVMDRVDGADDALRAVPRPQVRPDHPTRVLPVRRVLQHD